MFKKYIYIALAGGLLLPAAGCNKALDQPILGTYEAGKYFNSVGNAKAAVNAAYVPLNFGDAFANQLWVLGDVASDDAVKGGLAGDQADIDNINNFNILTSNAAVEGVWSRYYDGVSKANFVIQGLTADNAAVPDADKATIVGQAKFLRAYYYFILTNSYGDIPLRLEVATADNLQAPAVAQAQIFAQIEKDCQEAAQALPNSWTGADLGRATKGAALALLAKTYLFEKKYDAAVTAAEQVEALGYQLTPKFTDNFNAKTENNTEVIFAVQHVAGLSPKQGNGLNQAFAPRGALNGYGFFQPTQSLVDNFERSPDGVADPRLDYTVAREGHPYFDSTFDPSWTATGYLTKKQIQPLSEIPVATKGDADLNTEVLRFADVLLIKAEALNESGKSAQALVPLNKVRKRARESYLFDSTLGSTTIPAGLLPDVTTTDQSDLRAVIRRERRSELALEFGRFFDIIRYGSAYATNALRDVSNFNYEQHKFFPIPESERQTNKLLGR
ncbi:RagB/SusD family nutrient uptake outer membrane protein [Mucilaginibacter sp. UR6-1]|uniref:RagB/SusD family nutrient uptake outer membrane protein n=1 Tax=Mucilaginibacter sp. UR6-1 TaxID=1435643 RepID=UPI001E28A7BD|nr:RagB/SusD family nutrient uptake outer membrane protein [Mucilaginibacter sp. UR6-1]MCC8408198.1 RagB/SusD family nutrient uptake outer membrane protein [Mucilaginibacter sp. UR6-1]